MVATRASVFVIFPVINDYGIRLGTFLLLALLCLFVVNADVDFDRVLRIKQR